MLFFFSFAQATNEKVNIQLKWEHSFQFAGYYAALEQGYYKDLGLDVTLHDFQPENYYLDQVLNNESWYGVSDSSALLLYYLTGKPVSLVAQIFQSSPLVFLTVKDSGIKTPYDMVGKTVEINQQKYSNIVLNVMLHNTLGDIEKVNITPFSKPYYKRFIDGEVDVIAAYLSSQPFLFKQQNLEVNIIKPLNFGVSNYYGDNLFTSQKETLEHPQRASKMKLATIKGWEYALTHADEIIGLIQQKYSTKLDVDSLKYEARITKGIINPEIVNIGTYDLDRFQKIADDFKQLGYVESTEIGDDFIFQSITNRYASIKLTESEKKWIESNPEIVLGGSYNWAPFYFMDENKKYKGIIVDYFSLLSKTTGLKFTTELDSWDNQYQKLKNKQIDVLSALYYTQERSKDLLYTSAFLKTNKDFFFMRDDLNIKTLKDLNGKRVAIQKCALHQEIIKQYFPSINLLIVDSLETAIEAVLNNKADMLYDNYAATKYNLDFSEINSIIPFKSFKNSTIDTEKLHIGIRKDAPELASIIQKGVDFISEKQVNQIIEKWTEPENFTDNITRMNLSMKEMDWLNKHKTIKLQVNSTWPPYEFANKRGEFKGFSVDVINLIAKKISIKFDQNSDDWATAMNKIKNSEIDLILSIAKSPERSTFINFTEPFHNLMSVLYSRKDQPSLFSQEDLAGKVIAVENGFYRHKWFQEKHPEVKLKIVTTTLEALKAVAYGEADAYLGTSAVVNWLIDQNSLTNLKPNLITDKGFGNLEIRFGVRKDWEIFRNIINKALATITEAELASLRRKWLGINTVKQEVYLSDSETQWLNNHNTMTMLGQTDMLPYEDFDDKGNYIGIVADFLKIIKKELNINIDIKQRPDKFDIMSGDSSSHLQSDYYFTNPYASTPIVIVMNQKTNYIEGIEDVTELNIGLIKHKTYASKIIKKYPLLSYLKVKSIKDGLLAVSTGEIDVFLVPMAQASYYISNLGLGNIRVVGKTEFNTKTAFVIDQEFSQLSNLFNRALKNISLTERQNILNKWSTTDKIIKKLDYKLISIIAIISLIIIIFFILWIRRLALEIELRKSSEKRNQTIIDAMPLPILLTSLSGELIDANPQALKEFKINARDVTKYNLFDVYSNSLELEKLYKDINDYGQFHNEIFHLSGVDNNNKALVSGILLYYGDYYAILLISIDITERVEMEEEIKKNNTNSQVVLELTKSGFWHVDKNDGDYYHLSEHAANILGEIPKKNMQYHVEKEYWSRLVAANPDIAEKTINIYQNAIKSDCNSFSAVFDYKRPVDGLIVSIQTSGRIIRDENGKAISSYGAYQDITAQKQIEQTLFETKQLAESANKTKSQFLANMSHEIRTPMNAILGFAKLLKEQNTDPKQIGFIKTIDSAANNLLVLINDILDLSKIETGKFHIKHIDSDYRCMLSDLVDMFSIKFKDKNLVLIQDTHSFVPQILNFDENRLRQVLLNLIDNAYKFTEQGLVTIKTYTDNLDKEKGLLDLVIEVVDTGIGIDSHQQTLIFKDFIQASEQNFRRYGGTGLGLSISKKLVNLMNGEISLESKLGEGSTFKVTLYDVKIIQEEIEDEIINNQNTIPLPNSYCFHEASILIVDDISDNRKLLLSYFENTNVTIQEADCGADAIELVRKHNFDLILMDIRMPKMDGYETTEIIKTLCNTPVVALTATPQEANSPDKDLFQNHLTKPISREQLLLEVCKYLERSSATKQNIRNINDESKESMKELIHSEAIFLGNTIKKLRDLLPLHREISNNNTISQIKKFSLKVMKISSEHSNVILIKEYSNKLEQAITSFDIISIEKSLQQYTKLIVDLEQQ